MQSPSRSNREGLLHFNRISNNTRITLIRESLRALRGSVRNPITTKALRALRNTKNRHKSIFKTLVNLSVLSVLVVNFQAPIYRELQLNSVKGKAGPALIPRSVLTREQHSVFRSCSKKRMVLFCAASSRRTVFSSNVTSGRMSYAMIQGRGTCPMDGTRSAQ